MASEEANARWICCPMCDKKECEREADDCDVKTYLQNKAKSDGVGVTMEKAIEYFKSHCKIFCDDYMKKVPENSIAYQATLTEKGFYDLAIKALEKAREEKSLVYNNEEPSVFSCENCKYEPLSPEVEPCCDCKNNHKNYFEAKTSEVMEMTREEAINHIKYGIIENNYPLLKELGIEACKMAIKVLEQEPILDKIRAEIEQEILPRYSDQYDHERMWQNCGLRMALKVIDKYKAESEVSE